MINKFLLPAETTCLLQIHDFYILSNIGEEENVTLTDVLLFSSLLNMHRVNSFRRSETTLLLCILKL